MSAYQQDKQGFLGLLFSHHPVSERHLCVCVPLGQRKLYFCSRCLGIFPAMFLTLAAGRFTGMWPAWLEWSLLLLAPVPAILDWGTRTATGQPERANWFRFLTGLGVGIAAGASLHVNSYALLGPVVRAQLMFLFASTWSVWLFSYLRRRRARRARLKQRIDHRSSLGQILQESLKETEQKPDQAKPED